MPRSDQGGSGLGLSDWSNPRLPESPEVSLSYARVLGRVLGRVLDREVLIQNLIERVIQGILAAYRASRQEAPNSPANRRFLGPCPPALESRACLHVPVNGGGESPEASSIRRAPPSERPRLCVTKEARSLDRV